ncbi:hypothetical protein [Streptomyces sp. KAU_LT]|uniref:hypothetical protein n=1 Tax=Streptomyces sp. KAU_LT TaxID=3046669 RepID=UPI0024B82DDB|nr:hypothetical protein [Streptomyces sp. KAU_LT]MDI9829672.1 hypothetical protein [Streptomyces sp. KAU_LT]
MAEDVTLYYRTAAGVLATRRVSGDQVEAPDLPDGATALTAEEYETELAGVQAERQEYADLLASETEANQAGDYQALRALNVPEDTARRLTGYTGPDDAEA